MQTRLRISTFLKSTLHKTFVFNTRPSILLVRYFETLPSAFNDYKNKVHPLALEPHSNVNTGHISAHSARKNPPIIALLYTTISVIVTVGYTDRSAAG